MNKNLKNVLRSVDFWGIMLSVSVIIAFGIRGIKSIAKSITPEGSPEFVGFVIWLCLFFIFFVSLRYIAGFATRTLKNSSNEKDK